MEYSIITQIMPNSTTSTDSTGLDGFTAGTYKENLSGSGSQYRSFQPCLVNQPYQWSDRRIPVLLEEAMRLVGELNAYSSLIPDVDFFIQMHVSNEAVKSSRIEGTKTDVDEAMRPQDGIAPENRDDWEEVQNYVKAINYAIDKLGQLPICMRLLNDTHKILMKGVRGESKQPGKIRAMQNWVGGATINTATFIPPHQDELPVLLSDLEHFWHNPNLDMPNLIKIAISHYQFETLHPYNDGNGRVGRMLIVLHLIEMGILKKPTLYLSDFFAQHKAKYYEALTFVREQNNLDQWILFFLSAVSATATKGKDNFEKILVLRENYEQRIVALGQRAKHARKLLLFLFESPFVTVEKAAAHLEVSMSTANTVVNEMQQKNLLKEVTDHFRNRIFILHEYLDLFRD